MLEKQVGFDTDTADIAEHVGHLEMIRIRAEAIESALMISSTLRALIGRTYIS